MSKETEKKPAAADKKDEKPKASEKSAPLSEKALDNVTGGRFI